MGVHVPLIMNDISADALEEEILERASTSRSTSTRPGTSQKEVVNEQVAFINAGKWNIKIGDKAACSLALKLGVCDAVNLDLSNRSFGPRGFSMICRSIPQTNLTSLNLSGNPAGKSGVRALVEALPKSHLVQLRLFNTKLRDMDIRNIAEILPMSAVEVLDLGWNRMTDKGALCLSDVIPNCRLRDLSIQSNQVGDVGAEAIANSLAKSRVNYFNAAQNKIGNLGIQKLSHICSVSTSIVRMWLWGNIASLQAVSLCERNADYKHVCYTLPLRTSEKKGYVRIETAEEIKARERAEFEERRALSIADPSQKPNKPCLCLSGLKYKKCCKLRYMALMESIEADKRQMEMEKWANK